MFESTLAILLYDILMKVMDIFFKYPQRYLLLLFIPEYWPAVELKHLIIDYGTERRGGGGVQ